MYRYFMNTFAGRRAENTNSNSLSGSTAVASEEAACAAQRRAEEQLQRLSFDRRRAYTEFVGNAVLGKLLAARLPRAQDIPVYPGDAASALQNRHSSHATTIVHSEDSVLGSEPLTSSIHDSQETTVSTELECELYVALAPLLSRGTRIVTARALELLGCHAACPAEAGSHDNAAVLEKHIECIADPPSMARLPFLFVLLLLQRWQVCLRALELDVCSKAPPARMRNTLRSFSCILTSFVAVTEVHVEDVRVYLEDLRVVVTQCVEVSLRCLHLLSRAYISGTSYASDYVSGVMFLTEESRIASEAVEVQVWRLLSLLLYWMHHVYGAPVPHLNVVSVFLSTSTAVLDPANGRALGGRKGGGDDATTGRGNDSGLYQSPYRWDEQHRCTGLSNATLLRQAYVFPAGAASIATDGVTASLPLALMTSTEVRESLLSLLLAASKGVIPNVPSSLSHRVGLFKKFAAIDVDHDLGFVVVLSCRLLHYAFTTCAGTFSAAVPATPPSSSTTTAEHVRAAVGPLLGTLSILLARFIAVEDAEGADKMAGNPLADGLCSAAETHDADRAAPSPASSTILPPVPAAAAETINGCHEGDLRCCGVCDLPTTQHPRHIRLLGQLGCGILLLTTLFQQNAQSVLDTVDHSFLFDALVTTLQATGKRFAEPSAVPSVVASDGEQQCEDAPQAWSRWIEAVDLMSNDGAVPCQYDDLARLDVLQGAAMLRPVDDHLAILANEPIVDEFLHAYLGLLAASRCLRAAPVPILTSRGLLTNSGSSPSSQCPRLETRLLDTLDQLEQTLVKTFLTAYDVVDVIPEAGVDTVCFTGGASRPSNSAAQGGAETEEEGLQSAAVAQALPFPPTSCLYNLLLKHALWCLRMSRRPHKDLQPQAPQLHPSTHTLHSPTVTGTPKPSIFADPMSLPPLTFPTPLLSPPLAALRFFTPAASLSPISGPLATPARQAAVDLSRQGDDPFLLFLVHHGLLRILLLDKHYASAFMVNQPQRKANKSLLENHQKTGPSVQRKCEQVCVWQRSFATLLLISHCLQLHPLIEPDTTSAAAAAAGKRHPPSSTISPLLDHAYARANAQDGAAERLTSSMDLLTYETVEMLLMVLRPPLYGSLSSPPSFPIGGPGSAADALARTTVITAKSRYGSLWRNCLLALLTAALGTSSKLRLHDATARGDDVIPKDAKNTLLVSAAAPVVSEAIVCCDGAEYFLEASMASAAATSPFAQDVSFRWAMCALQGLAMDPKARVHMAATCARPLLLGVLWNPLLRRGGRELLTSLLCQPLAASCSTVDMSLNDPREAAVVIELKAGNKADTSSSSTTAAAADSDTLIAAAVAHTVPRHCRKLCEALWLMMTECVNGPLPTNNAVAEASGGVPEKIALPSAAPSNDETREAVLQAILSALTDAFSKLGCDSTRGFGNAEELLPLRTLQRGLYEASKDGSMHIYALLLHSLVQSWRSNTSSPTDPSTPAPFSLPPTGAPRAGCELCAAGEPLPSANAGSLPSTARVTLPCSAARPSCESVILITKVLVGLTKANPTQHEMLYVNTIDEEALVDCITNAWTAMVHGAACNSSWHNSESCRIDDVMSGEYELVRLCSYLVYESIEALDAFLDDRNPSAVGEAGHLQQHQPVSASPCAWSLQNPKLLSAVLKRFSRKSLAAPQQRALYQILRTLTHTVASCHTSLYLASSTSLHEVLGQLLPVVALLPSNASGARPSHSAPPSATATATSPRLDVMLVHLLVMLMRCNFDVRQLKQLLMLVIHSKQLRERRALVPLVVQLLSAAAQPLPSTTLRQVHNRTPRHFMALHRGRGPAGFRAALPEFPLEGYSVSLFLRWEGELATAAGGEGDAAATPLPGLDGSARPTNEVAHRSPSCCACIFSLRTADHISVMALMVERHTGRLLVEYRNLQHQWVRVRVAAMLPSREWSHVVLSHRPAAFLNAAAGGQLHIAVNSREVVTVPQVAYPLMSRGHLYIGCLGHEVDRLSVAHAFYGQVSTAYFFPFVLQEREWEILQNSVRESESSSWTAASTLAATSALRSAATVATSSRWPSAGALRSGGGGEGVEAETETEQWLAARATLRIDTRLSDRGHLYNFAAVLRGRAGRDSRLFTFEGTLVCSTQWVMDSMGLLGALPSVVMPLCTLLVNPTLPISYRGLAAVAHDSSESPLLPSWAMAPSGYTGDAYDPDMVDTANAAMLWALELIPVLVSSGAIRKEMADSGLFVFFGEILQLLGPSLPVVMPVALIQLLEALVPYPRLFEDALTNLFLSSEVIHAAPPAVQLTWVRVQRSFLEAHPDVLSCLRSLGTSMFVAAELLRTTSEENSEDTADQKAATTPQSPPSATAEASCTLYDFEHQWMLYFEALVAPPITVSEAQSLQYIIENLRWTCSKEPVQLRILRRVRHLVTSTTSPYFVQLLGRRSYAVTLIPYIKDSPSEAVRMEALLQLLCVVFRSKRTQELMNPVLLASRDTVVHVAEEVSLSWLKDALQQFPVNLSVYLALRCGLVGQFDVPEMPTTYAPLGVSQTLKFAAVLLPLLMLLKRSTDAALKAYALTDLAVLLKSDAQAWRRLITVRGWYVSLTGLFASSSSTTTAAAAPTATVATDETDASTASPASQSSTEAPSHLRSSDLLFTTTSMILSYTLFQALLHESYGATELALVAAYLREQRLHCLLHQVLCNVADRYHSRLQAQRNTRRILSSANGSSSASGPGETRVTPSTPFMLLAEDDNRGAGISVPPSSTAPAASFIGLGTPTALLNMCYFFRIVEVVLFYAAPVPKGEAAAAVPVSFSSAASLSSATATQPSPSPPPLEDVLQLLSSRGGYTEWEELLLLPAEVASPAMDRDGNSSDIAPETSKAKSMYIFDDAYYAAESDDPQGNIRRAFLKNPDDRWLHMPLAAKCAKLLCIHSTLLHLGSNGNTTSISFGGSGAVVGATTSTGGPGDALLAAVMSAASGSSAAVSNVSLVPSGQAVLKGGMLRLFGRLLRVMCSMTLRSAPALESIINLVDDFIRTVDRGQRSSGFLLLKRAVNADEAHDHSPIAVSMTLVYSIHDLLLRRLRAEECGGSSAHPNANAALVDRMKSLVEIFHYSFAQLPAFAAAGASSAVSSTASPALLPDYRRELSRAVGRGGRGDLFLDDPTGEIYTAGMSTLQWLCDHHANPRRTVEAFAEVASRADYHAFVERCVMAVEREQSTDKIIANVLLPEQRVVLRRLQDLFCENSLSRRLVHDNIKAVMKSSRCAQRSSWGGGSASKAENGGALTVDESADNSFTTFFLPSAARKVTAAARAATWAQFTTALRGTVWNLEAAGPQQQQQQRQLGAAATTQYVKLSLQEQQALVHRKLVFDRDGTNYSGVSMTPYSSLAPLAGESAPMFHPVSLSISTALGDGVKEGDGSASSAAGTNGASRLRLRGGEAVLLQVPEEEDAAAEEDVAPLGVEGEMRPLMAASLDEFPSCDAPALDQRRKNSSSATAQYDPAIQSVLSVQCEVPYMMHCWSASFTVRGSKVVVLIDDENKAYNQMISDDARPYLLRPRTFSFRLSHVVQIAPGRRFRMQRTALEVWTCDRRSYFINFADAATMNAALQVLRAGGTPRYPFMTPFPLQSATGTVMTALPALARLAAGGYSRRTVYVLQENPRREPMRLRAMALWRNRLLSNFDYLLVLNLLAGRTLSDITQYPVFPWILSDYTSSELDLSNPATFRDLSLPMGACGREDRRTVVRERYTEMKDLGDVPSHYFTHYSSPAVTLYFLIRLPPYTALSILLQGGHFDHADRMFHSVQASYKAVTTSTQDVRELIPELFYLPELCINANRVDFGRRQDRTPMDNLQLPPWAHNDPYTFTYRMREALESPHVSAHLHKWIDLIFGYKQRGKEAIDALNVFNWHSYEDLDRNSNASTVNRQLLIDSIDNIGQTPIQLFRQPHLPRPALEWADPLLLPTHVKTLPLRWGCARVAKVVVLATDKVLVVTGNGGTASLRMHLNLVRQSTVSLAQSSASNSLGGASTATGTPSAAGQVQSGRSLEAQKGISLSAERVLPTSHGVFRGAFSGPLPAPAAAALSSVGRPPLGGADTGSFDVSEEYERRITPLPPGVIPNNSPYADGSSTASSVALLCYEDEVFLVLGGIFDNSVAIRSLSGAAGDVRLRAHHGHVTLVVCTGDSCYLVTGAEDTTFVVWSCQLQPDRPRLEVELLFTIYGHEDMPSAADVNSTLDIVATASLDGVLMLHSLSTGSLDRVIRHPRGAPIHRVLLQANCYVPNLIFLSNQDGRVHQYSINGASLRTFMPPGRVMTWTMTPSQYFLMACQPHPYVHSNNASPRNRAQRSSNGVCEAELTPPPTGQAVNEPCVLYVHSFFLEVVKTVAVPADHVVSSLSVHPSYPQVVVAGTENARLLLLQSTIQQ
ncbi:hypothetical protein ABL78_2646 [Leptomonas seymouri]|uniref:Neurobeachin/beige protein n=1 Tax=Leptomonas seymouri TaxID=5684 RepID=A0A0N1ILT2_LEPSE|nr:hypothetical protein ABL78_2646 [Leptomonas seymouri]|eukprot:KPI88284.1 hypothetical protein ABL78_2646 [Leptomonas seymouri]